MDSTKFGFISTKLVTGRVVQPIWKKFVARVNAPRSRQNREEDYTACVARAEIYFQEGRIDDALADCDTAISAQSTAEPAEKIKAHLIRAEANLSLGRLNEAEADCEQALNTERDRLLAHALEVRGSLRYRRSDYTAASENFLAAWEKDDSRQFAFYEYAATQLDLKQPKKAMEICDRVDQDLQNQSGVRNLRAIACLMQGDRATARAYINAILETGQPAPLANVNAAYLSLLDGNEIEAKKYWLSALGLEKRLQTLCTDGSRPPVTHYAKVYAELADKFGEDISPPDPQVLLNAVK